MEISVKGRHINVEFSPIILTTTILGWSIYYYFSTIRTPDGGDESVLFIRPLIILLSICYPFVIHGALKISTEKKVSDMEPTETSTDADRGFLDHRRLFFAGSLIVYAVGITFFGYIIPSVLFVFVVCFYLGVRNLWVLAGLPVLLSVFLAVVFRVFIGVPIPIWPWSN